MKKDQLYYKNRHSVYFLQYHLVVVTKYRHPVITGDLKDRLIEISHSVIESDWKCSILEINSDMDHIHILVSLGTKYSVKEIVNVLKGVSARMLRRDYGETIRKYLWKDSFWSDSYFIATSGGVTLETLKKYVEEQGRPKRHYQKHKKADSSPTK